MQARSVDQLRPAASAAVEQRAMRRLLHHVHHTLLAPGSLPAMPDAAHTHRVEVARQPAVPAGLAGSRSGSWRSRRRRRLPPPPSPRSRSRLPPPRRRGGGPDRRGGLGKGARAGRGEKLTVVSQGGARGSGGGCHGRTAGPLLHAAAAEAQQGQVRTGQGLIAAALNRTAKPRKFGRFRRFS